MTVISCVWTTASASVLCRTAGAGVSAAIPVNFTLNMFGTLAMSDSRRDSFRPIFFDCFRKRCASAACCCCCTVVPLSAGRGDESSIATAAEVLGPGTNTNAINAGVEKRVVYGHTCTVYTYAQRVRDERRRTGHARKLRRRRRRRRPRPRSRP